AVQFTGLAPVHAPAWQVSVCVHALLSLHALPLGLLGLLHTPVVGLHTPGSWHWSCAVQFTGLPPVHAPASQASVWVQALLSLQAARLGLLGLLHTPVVVSHTPGS